MKGNLNKLFCKWCTYAITFNLWGKIFASLYEQVRDPVTFQIVLRFMFREGRESNFFFTDKSNNNILSSRGASVCVHLHKREKLKRED